VLSITFTGGKLRSRTTNVLSRIALTLHLLAVGILVALAVPRATLEDRALAYNLLLAVEAGLGVINHIFCRKVIACESSLEGYANETHTFDLLVVSILVAFAVPRTALEDRALAYNLLLAVEAGLGVINHVYWIG
jgi:type III secretory pathway component EscS